MGNALRRRLVFAEVDQVREGFLRGLSLLLILLGLHRWAQIIGVIPLADGAAFAELSGAWQAAIINLSVAFPVAAVGLWILTRWGVVLWVYAAGAQIAMHTVFAGAFGFRLIPIVTNVVLIAAYAGLVSMARRAAADHRQAEKANRRVTPDDRPVGVGRFTAGARAKLAAALTQGERSEVPASASADQAPATDNASR